MGADSCLHSLLTTLDLDYKLLIEQILVSSEGAGGGGWRVTTSHSHP